MAIKINLLPPGYGVAGTLGKVLKVSRSLGVVGLGLFFVFALGISAYYIISVFTLNNLNSQGDALKSQISALEATEQQVVLLKDRIQKVNTVLGLPEAVQNFDSIDPLVSNLGTSSTLSQLSVDPQKIGISLQFRSNADATAFINALSTNQQNFSSVTLSSFGYNPTYGYSMEVAITK